MSTTVSPEYPFTRCYSLVFGEYVNGIAYDEEIVSCAGAAFTLYPHEKHTPEEVLKAEHKLRADRDVTSIHVRRVPSSWYPEEHRPDDSKEKSGQWLDSMRQIVAEGSYKRVGTDGAIIPEGKRGGALIDLFTASICCQVYDALNEANQAKLRAMPVYVAINACLKVANGK